MYVGNSQDTGKVRYAHQVGPPVNGFDFRRCADTWNEPCINMMKCQDCCSHAYQVLESRRAIVSVRFHSPVS